MTFMKLPRHSCLRRSPARTRRAVPLGVVMFTGSKVAGFTLIAFGLGLLTLVFAGFLS